jgi:hypothetical protein
MIGINFTPANHGSTSVFRHLTLATTVVASGQYGCDVVPYDNFAYQADSDNEAISICQGHVNEGAWAWCANSPNNPGFTLSYRTYGGSPYLPLHDWVDAHFHCEDGVPIAD